MNLDKILLDTFGYSEFRSGQREIIEAINEGKNVLAVLPTGGGKSLCYQIPALLSDSFSIVISPLIALMKDQVDSINKDKKIAAFINSSLEFNEIEEVLRNIVNCEIKLLYLAPEKLENNRFAERIKSLAPSRIYIDEAHCISEWGHNFRPSYRNIKEFCKFVGVKEISAFTATATPEVRKDIITQLELVDPVVFIKGFERENLYLRCEHSNQKKEKTLEILEKHESPAIIYTSTRKNAEELSDYLKLNDINCSYYHAGLSSEMRRMIQDDFLSDRIDIIVATNAFGMGIDKKDIRLIVHYNMPGSIESYYQEIGRAGRDEKDSYAYMLYDGKDKHIQEFFIQNSFINIATIKKVYSAICNYGKVALGNAYSKPIPIDKNLLMILNNDGISKALLLAAIKILSNSNYLKMNSGLDSQYYLEFNMHHENLKKYIKSLTNNNYKEILIILLREYGNELFYNKSKININKLSRLTDLDTDDLIEKLEGLSNIGIIEFEKPLNSQSVSLAGTRVREDMLIVDMEQINRNYETAKHKLDSIVNLCYSKECRFKDILKYFGEDDNYTCGKCDNCLGQNNDQRNEQEYLEEIVFNTVKNTNGKYSKIQLINILLGKEREQDKLIPNFAALQNYSYSKIESIFNDLQNKNKIKNDNEGLNIVRKIMHQKSDKGNYEDRLELFNKLRHVRKTIAQKFNQTPELICSDDILRDISTKKPSTPSTLLLIKGFNNRKFNKAGEEFLKVINKHIEEKNKDKVVKTNSIPKTLETTLSLINKGYSFNDIVSLQKLPESVASLQIETLIGYFNDIDISKLFDKNEFDQIKLSYENGYTTLPELKDELPNNITFSKIRIVVAKLRKGKQ